jgi:DNA-binding NtrC family response regulator
MSRTILIIDENEISRCAMAQFLKRRGYEVCEAESGEAGLDMMEAKRFDILIANHNIHGAFDGADILTYQERLYPGSHKILVTTSNSENIETLARLINAVYVEKPVSLDQLISNVECVRPAPIVKAEHDRYRTKTIAWQRSMQKSQTKSS